MDKIIVKDVVKTLKGKTVLNHVELELEKGLVHGFFGRNGSGKTMLLRAVSGLIAPDEGYVEVFGRNLTKERAFPESMGIVIENIGLWKHLTARENLRLIADIRGVIGDKEIDEALEAVGLEPDDKRKYKAFSMGMRQKLALAQAIMEKPELLILDEPTNGLDDDAVESFRAVLQQQKQRGATCLVATHQKEDVKDLCDKVYHVRDGHCAEVSKEEW